MAENIIIDPFDSSDPDLELIGELYCVAFIGKSYSAEDKYNTVVNINKHSSYEGFKSLKAKNKDGKLIGFGYGYSSMPDQFYRQKIAAQLSETQKNDWLNNCFEFVELAINPSYRRHGIASQLHDALINKNDHKTSILTTWFNNGPGINFYKSKGWIIIKADAPVITEDDLQVIMGKTIKKDKTEALEKMRW